MKASAVVFRENEVVPNRQRPSEYLVRPVRVGEERWPLSWVNWSCWFMLHLNDQSWQTYREIKLIFLDKCVNYRMLCSTVSNCKGCFVVNLPGTSADVTADMEGTVGAEVDGVERQCSAEDEDGDGPKMKKTTTTNSHVRCHFTLESYTAYCLNRFITPVCFCS